MTSEQFPTSNNEDNPGLVGHLRAENDGDRSSEFKSTRDLFVDDVNNWLSALAAIRDEGVALQLSNHGGAIQVPFLDSPRRVTTDLGSTRHGVTNMGINTTGGVWLGGDGQTQPYHLQAFIPDNKPGVNKYIEVHGTDPIAAMVHGGETSSGRSSEIVASAMIEYDDDTGREEISEYSVKGDGAMNVMTRGVDGMTRIGNIRNEVQAAEARRAFNEEIAASFIAS